MPARRYRCGRDTLRLIGVLACLYDRRDFAGFTDAQIRAGLTAPPVREE